MNLELITKQVANLTRAIGNYIKTECHKLESADIESKGFNDFVTHVDKTAEQRLASELKKILPEAGIIAEENPNYERKGQYNWIIDPLDGTTNFIHGVPLYSISIALAQNEKVISGVVFEVNLHECFYAWDQGGAYLNGHSISVSTRKKISDGLIATGFPYSDFSRMEQYMAAFDELMRNTHGIRRLGSAAVDLAYVAAGRYDAFWEYGLSPWDVAGGAILVKEAGGIVSDFSGNDNYIFGKEMIATNQLLSEEFSSLIRSKFSQ